MSKQLVFPEHVRLRMKERGIEASQIRFTIFEPHATMPTRDPKRSRHMREFTKGTLDVIFEERKDHIIVVTAAWLKDDDRTVKPR